MAPAGSELNTTDSPPPHVDFIGVDDSASPFHFHPLKHLIRQKTDLIAAVTGEGRRRVGLLTCTRLGPPVCCVPVSRAAPDGVLLTDLLVCFVPADSLHGNFDVALKLECIVKME